MESEPKKVYGIWSFINDLLMRNDTAWLSEIEEFEPFILNNWIAQAYPKQAMFMDDYINLADKKMFYALYWSILPKGKTVFIKYPKKEKVEDDEMQFIWDAVKKKLGISQRDFNEIKHYYVADFEKDKKKYLRMFGADKSVWKKFGLEKEIEGKEIRGKFGLATWDDL